MELPEAIDWPEITREWWAAWQQSPQTADWDDLQWHYLLDTALIHATVWGNGDVSRATELRARIERLGGVIPATAKPSKAKRPTQNKAASEDRGVTPLDELRQRRANRATGA